MTPQTHGSDAGEGSPPPDSAGQAFLLLGTSVLAFYACLLLGSAVALTFKVAAHPAFLAVAGAVALWWIFRGGDASNSPSARWAAALMFVIAQGTSVVYALSALDLSFDGRWYHKEAVLLITEGWNPYRDGPLTDVPIGPAGLGGSSNWHENLGQETLNGYPKSPWIVGALYALMFDDLEAAKAPNTLLALGAMAVAFGAMSAFGIRGLVFRASGAFLLAFGATTAAQLGTTMVDGQLASLMVMALSFGALLATRATSPWIEAAFGLSLGSMMLVKFTGIPYGAAILLGGAGLTARFVDRPAARRMLVAGAGGLVVVFVLAGWNPYLTNALRFGWLFHPMPGYGLSTVASVGSPIDAVTPENLRGRIGPAKLALSLLASSDAPGRKAARLKWPWETRPDELDCFAREGGCFVGGHGPLFALCLALSLVGVALLRREPPHRGCALALGAAGLLAATAVAMPESWVARYAPQLGFVPVLILMVLARSTRRRLRVTAIVLGLALACNSAVVLSAGLRGPMTVQRWFKGQLWRLDHDWKRTRGPLVVNFGTFRSMRVILRRAGIPFEEMRRDLGGCRPVQRVYDVIWCAPGPR